MVVIGVDSSGHVKNPPIYVVAVRRSKRRGQRVNTVYVSPQRHEEYLRYVREMNISHWFEKISAILIFKAILGFYYVGDSINIDWDFLGKSRNYVERYLKKLFLIRFPRNPKLNNPNIMFIPARYSNHVKEAHKKSKKARYGRIPLNIKDPKITKEILLLK